MAQRTENLDRLADFPISFFATVMGLAGLTIAWEKAQQVFHVDLQLNAPLFILTAGVFLALLTIYGFKLARQQQEVFKELRHPIKLNFFPTLSSSLVLLSIALMPMERFLAHPLWMAGMLLHLAFTLYVVNVWMHHEHFQVKHLNPAWFIPAVGDVLIPVAGVPLGYLEISWFFFSVGMLFWLLLLAVIF